MMQTAWQTILYRSSPWIRGWKFEVSSDNSTLKAKGKVEKMAGKIQEKIGQVEKVFEK